MPPKWLLKPYRASGSGRYRVVSTGTEFDDDHFAVIREIRRWRPLRLGWWWTYHFCHSTHPTFVAADREANCAADREKRRAKGLQG